MMVTAQQLAEQMPDTRELLSDEPQMETKQHYQQLALLVSHLEWYWRDRADFFIGANLTVYYTHEQLRVRRFLGPDFFLVRDVDPRLRTSWVVWEEDGRYPDLIIAELAKLPAGRVNELKSEEYRDLRQRAARKMMAPAAPAPMVAMEMAAGAADMAAPKEIIKEGLSEYFIYDWRQD